MAQHWQRSSAARNWSLGHVDRLDDLEVIKTLAYWRWGDENIQVCPSCGVARGHKWRKCRDLWRCRDCEFEFSVTSGTPFSNHRIPLRMIMQAFVMFANSAHSISADALMKHFGIAQKTAWLLRGKIREALSKTRPVNKFKGIVQVDGMYVCGKPHKANMRKKKDVEGIQEKVTTGKVSRKRLTRQEFRNLIKRKNRRVIISIRQIGTGQTQASDDTYAFVTMSENEVDATAMIRSLVEPGTTVMSDECPAYNSLDLLGFNHQVVQHSIQFCTDDGVNDNQCESFNSRLRRAEYGVFHNLMPQYLQSIVDEFVWRENTRQLTNLERVSGLVNRVFKAGFSKFRGYYQRRDKRGKEVRWVSFKAKIDEQFGATAVMSGAAK